jgi:hypothetical protein
LDKLRSSARLRGWLAVGASVALVSLALAAAPLLPVPALAQQDGAATDAAPPTATLPPPPTGLPTPSPLPPDPTLVPASLPPTPDLGSAPTPDPTLFVPVPTDVPLAELEEAAR